MREHPILDRTQVRFPEPISRRLPPHVRRPPCSCWRSRGCIPNRSLCMYSAKPDHSSAITRATSVVRMHAGATDLDRTVAQMLEPRRDRIPVRNRTHRCASQTLAAENAIGPTNFAGVLFGNQQMVAPAVEHVAVDTFCRTRQARPHLLGEHAIAQALSVRNLRLAARQMDGLACVELQAGDRAVVPACFRSIKRRT